MFFLEFKQVKKSKLSVEIVTCLLNSNKLEKIQFLCWNCDFLIEFQQNIEFLLRFKRIFSRKNVIFGANRL